MVEYKIVEHMSYDWVIVAYFFFGGLSVGSYIFSVIANYWRKEFQPLAKRAAMITPLFLALGMFLLLLDLGQPLRSWRLFLHFNPTSAISWGVWFLNIFFILSLIYAGLSIKGEEEKAKKIAYFGLPFSLLVGAYTGVLLTQAPGRALWHSPLNPILFVIGGLISGIAAVMLISARSQSEDLLRRTGKLVSGLILLELGLILVEVIYLLNGGVEQVSIAKTLLMGNNSLMFWGVEITLGALIPLYIFLQKKITIKAYTLASLLILIGIYTMRYIIVVGGQVPTF